ncbi:MAG: glutathione S-transferase family protein [Gammaproteobacteria bacterium]|nr:glutathione S-transferase family protein [Gammaproteobacteria bacterium]
MKLHQTYLSPFPTRVRLVLYAKGIEFEVVEPPGFHGDPNAKGDYLNVNPIGRVPALELDDGKVLPESEVICEYLEEAYPDVPLMPEDPWARAQVRLLSRISDIYLVMAMLPLFNMAATPPKTWDQEKIRRQLSEIGEALDFLEEYVGDKGYAVGTSLTHADGTLVPILLLVDEWLPIFRGPELWQRRPKLERYWREIGNDPICARLIEETRTALQQSMGRT